MLRIPRRPIPTAEPDPEIRQLLNQVRAQIGVGPMPEGPIAIGARDRTLLPVDQAAAVTAGFVDMGAAFAQAITDAGIPNFGALREKRSRKWGERGTTKDLLRVAKKRKVEQITDPLDPRLATFWMLAERTANDLDFCTYYDLFVDTIGGPNREKRK